MEHPLLEDLFKARGLLPAGLIRPPEGELPRQEKPLRQPDYSKVDRIVLRYERKGHGGKAVTRVEGLSFAEGVLEELARELKKAMGCGAWVEGNEILLQGDLSERLQAWFQKKGVKRVVISKTGGFSK